MYDNLPEIDSKLLDMEWEKAEREHVFSENFENKMKDIITVRTKKKKPVIYKAAVILLCILFSTIGTGAVVNAATGGELFTYIYNIFFYTDDGATYNFEYTYGTESDSESVDIPDGAVAGYVYYVGDGKYTLENGELISKERLIFLNGESEEKANEKIAVYILDEDAYEKKLH